MKPMLFNVFFPIGGAFLLLLFPRKIKPALSVAIIGATFLFSLWSASSVYANRGMILATSYLTDWFSFSFFADTLAVFMAGVSSFVALLIAVYSLDYMKHYSDNGSFYFWMVLFIGSMMGLIYSANLLLLFCFWEVTSVCSWRLIGFYRHDKDIQAADKAFLVTFFGASIMLIGIILIYLKFDSLELVFLKGSNLPNMISLLLLAGVVSKSAQLPLQSWLPDAGVAPTPVTALLHAAVLVKIGVYVFARIFGLTFISSAWFLNSAIIVASLSILVAAGSALLENNMKRILAYSTISQLGYILLAFAINNEDAFKIGMIYILAHSLGKAGLFLCMGIVEQKSGTKDINDLGGLARTMPYTAAAYLLCAFSIIGLPPFLGFWPKFMVVLLAVNSGHLFAGSAAVVGALFTLFYLARLFNKVFLGPLQINAAEDRRSVMVWVVAALGILSLLLGLYFKLPFSLVAKLYG